jgi:hypothetical protein
MVAEVGKDQHGFARLLSSSETTSRRRSSPVVAGKVSRKDAFEDFVLFHGTLKIAKVARRTEPVLPPVTLLVSTTW